MAAGGGPGVDFVPVAQPARRTVRKPGVPVYDPGAVQRRYAAHRARREARVQRVRARRWARFRFVTVLLVLLALAAFLAVALWREIERLFGL
jgi:hypothetical protein